MQMQNKLAKLNVKVPDVAVSEKRQKVLKQLRDTMKYVKTDLESGKQYFSYISLPPLMPDVTYFWSVTESLGFAPKSYAMYEKKLLQLQYDNDNLSDCLWRMNQKQGWFDFFFGKTR